MKYYLIAGEASGDLHASNLMRELRNQDPQAEFRFFGGDLMQAQGGTLVKHYREMAFMGFIAVLRNLPQILENMRICMDDILSYRPDVLILVDYPSFNLKVAKAVKQNLGIPIHYYISPKIWAWKEYRIKDIKRYIDKMFCILPFETSFYQKHNYSVEYVGNPTVDELMDLIKNNNEEVNFRQEHELSKKPIVAILAGSRKAEVISNLPMMLEAMGSFSDYQVVVAGAPGLDALFYDRVIGKDRVKVVFGQTYRLLQVSQAALVTSGTATLETAVLGVPQVVCYKLKGGRLFYEIMSRVLKVRFVSLVNLIVDEEVVKELLGYKLTVESIREELGKILPEGDARTKMLNGYERMCLALGGKGAAKKAAASVIRNLKES